MGYKYLKKIIKFEGVGGFFYSGMVDNFFFFKKVFLLAGPILSLQRFSVVNSQHICV